MRGRKILKTQVVDDLLHGKLTVAEAMERCKVKNKLTVLRWVKRSVDEIQSKQLLAEKLPIAPAAVQSPLCEEEIKRLQGVVDTLKKSNSHLVDIQINLTKRINDLELLIEYVERTYQINVLQIRKQKKKVGKSCHTSAIGLTAKDII